MFIHVRFDLVWIWFDPLARRIDQTTIERNGYLAKGGGSLMLGVVLTTVSFLLPVGRYFLVFTGLLAIGGLLLGRAWRSNQQLSVLEKLASSGEAVDVARLDERLHHIAEREERGLPAVVWVAVVVMLAGLAGLMVWALASTPSETRDESGDPTVLVPG